MKNIKRKHWVVFGLTAFIYIVWAITIATIINFSDKLGVSEKIINEINKILGSTFIQGTMYIAVFMLFFFAPNIKFLSKNFNGRVDASLIEMRRNLCCASMLCLVVGFFGMAMMNMHWKIVGEGFVFKVGPRELFGLIAMGGVAISCCLYFYKAKKVIYLDSFAHANDSIIIESKTKEEANVNP